MAAGTKVLRTRMNGDQKCCATDNTNIFWGLDNGEIWQEVISSKALTRIASVNQEILSICYYSNILYIGCSNGATFSVTTA